MAQDLLVAVLRRDRSIVLAALAGICALAWWYMVHEARLMVDTGVCQCIGMMLSGPDMAPWSLSQLIPLFVMWAEMMVAMMIPSAAPMILMVATINRKRQQERRPYVPTAIFALGYLTVWTIASAGFAALQWVLHGAALLSPMMVSSSPVLAGVLLIFAGLFQWTRFKAACLRHCRSPLDLVLTGWREGKAGAFNMGFRHGAYCTGCCWLMMLLLFVAGVMNIWWIAVLSILVLVEKSIPRGDQVAKALGIVFMLWGAALIIG